MGSGEKQASANTPAWLALLFAIALVSFFVLGSLIARREVHATAWADLHATESSGEVVTPGREASAVEAETDPLALLARGVIRRAAVAAQALSQGEVTAGAVAMDAAMRAAEVGRDGAPDPARAAFDSALRVVRRARAERQNGRLTSAVTTIRQVDRALAGIRSATPVPPRSVGDYDGARLLNVAGTIIGVVEHVPSVASGRPNAATLVIGGYHHVLGFLDFGGTRVTVPVERLVFGKARTLGPTRVVLATTATTPAEVRRQLAATAMTMARGSTPARASRWPE